jgi:hypothetical protein
MNNDRRDHGLSGASESRREGVAQEKPRLKFMLSKPSDFDGRSLPRNCEKASDGMAESTKILQVTFGGYSCTLEGFEDPVEAMIVVTEYFRDLAERDPSFAAAEPGAGEDRAWDMARAADRLRGNRAERSPGPEGVLGREGVAVASPSAPEPVAPPPGRAATDGDLLAVMVRAGMGASGAGLPRGGPPRPTRSRPAAPTGGRRMSRPMRSMTGRRKVPQTGRPNVSAFCPCRPTRTRRRCRGY